MRSGQMEYDRMGVDVFSPDGRLFQVEYAREAVKRGTTGVGIVCRDGVVLISDKRIASRLVVPSSVEKIYKIDGHIACSVSGLVADARILADYGREVAQEHRMTYGERIGVPALAKRLCDIEQVFTQRDGLRPFGAAFLIAGRDDDGYHLFETDPSGSLVEYLSGGIGTGYGHVKEFFEREFITGLSVEEGLDLGVRALVQASDLSLDPATVDAGRIADGADFEFFQRGVIGDAIIRASGKSQ